MFAVSSDPAYLEILKAAVQMKHQCHALHLDSIPLTLENGGETVWGGIVEVFALVDHKTATRCYAWTETVNECEQRFVVILQKGFVITPAHAVKAWLATRPIVIHPVVPGSSFSRRPLESPGREQDSVNRTGTSHQTLSIPAENPAPKATVFP